MAPTKPLVAQQIDASHRVCGIPGSHAAEVTGETSRVKRLHAVRGLRNVGLYALTDSP